MLFIADEIQTGLGRTGKLFACDHENVRPDIMIIGKALAGGFYPVSAVLADQPILGIVHPRGAWLHLWRQSLLAAAVARAALKVIVEEKLVSQRSQDGRIFHGPIG